MIMEDVFQQSFPVLTMILMGLMTVLIVRWLMQKWKYNYPPGPRGLPLIGNLLQVNQAKLHKQAFEWSKVYGPVITVHFGRTPYVYVNKIDAALEVLVKKSTDFASRMTTPSIAVVTYDGKDIAFGDYGPTWKLHRKIATKALRTYMQGDALEERVHGAVETTFAEIDKISGPFNPAEYINFMIANIVTGLCFGGKYEFDDEELLNILQAEDELDEVFGESTLEDIIPGLKYIYKTAKYRRVEDITHKVCEDFIRKKIKEEEAQFDRENMRHFTDNMLLAKLEAEEEEGSEAVKALTEDHLVQTITDIYTNSLDTSRITMSFAVLHMLAFPDIQEKVQQEIDRVVGMDRLPGMADRPNLSYTEAVLHESMRLATAVPNGLVHVTSCDTQVGYRIPKGTPVVVNLWALHSDPEAWDEVDRFIPERYLDENGKLGPKPKNWLPFSAGKRVCLGEFVAKPELHLMFACLMQRYRWTMESGRYVDLDPIETNVLHIPKPYKAIVTKRI